jgi:hypothetical protein
VSVEREWVRIPVSDDDIKKAVALRKLRDATYPHHTYPPGSLEKRAAGELGEFAVGRWMKSYGTPFTWISEKPIGQPDFVVGDETVDVKCSSVPYPVRQFFGFTINAYQAENPSADTILFSFYEEPSKTVVIVGVMAHGDFMAGATFRKEGQKIDDLIVHKGGDCYHVYVSQMTSPKWWLENA